LHAAPHRPDFRKQGLQRTDLVQHPDVGSSAAVLRPEKLPGHSFRRRGGKPGGSRFHESTAAGSIAKPSCAENRTAADDAQGVADKTSGPVALTQRRSKVAPPAEQVVSLARAAVGRYPHGHRIAVKIAPAGEVGPPRCPLKCHDVEENRSGCRASTRKQGASALPVKAPRRHCGTPRAAAQRPPDRCTSGRCPWEPAAAGGREPPPTRYNGGSSVPRGRASGEGFQTTRSYR